MLERVYTLALLHRLDGDESWRARAVAELRAAAAFSDWNPSHFLDVAEMSHAFAIGYDWLYGALSEDDRALAPDALVQKGLLPAADAYARRAWWASDRFNWNLVCNGGIALAALALADAEPDLCRPLLYRALQGMPAALASYAPDGAWAEGPGYWSYATKYAVSALAALQSALGTDFGLSTLPGLAGAGTFRLQSAGPTGLFFNFADAGERAGRRAGPVLARPALRRPPPGLGGEGGGRQRPAPRAICSGTTPGVERGPVPHRPGRPLRRPRRGRSCAPPGRTRRPSTSASRAATTRPTTPTSIWARSSSTPSGSAGPPTSARTTTTCPATSTPR